jgi:hypothetical protein
MLALRSRSPGLFHDRLYRNFGEFSMSWVEGETGENPDGTTYLFPDVEGESARQIEAKKKTGYLELTWFIATNANYCCGSCEYMIEAAKSPTGFYCSKYKYFDRPNGCCDGYELKPELRRYKDAITT